MRKGQQIPGLEECLELVRELETKDPRAAKTLLDDAFSSGSTPEGPANAAGGMLGALMAKTLKDKVEEKLQELKPHQSTLPDPAAKVLSDRLEELHKAGNYLYKIRYVKAPKINRSIKSAF